MFWFRQPARPRPVLRTRLGLESLDGRVLPSDLFGGGDPPSLGGQFVSVNAAPRIIEFGGVETSAGWYRFSGRVVDSTTVGGLVVRFEGVASIDGLTATTAADGTFTIDVQVRTDGTDSGEVRATTTADGLTSNVASCIIDPGS